MSYSRPSGNYPQEPSRYPPHRYDQRQGYGGDPYAPPAEPQAGRYPPQAGDRPQLTRQAAFNESRQEPPRDYQGGYSQPPAQGSGFYSKPSDAFAQPRGGDPYAPPRDPYQPPPPGRDAYQPPQQGRDPYQPPAAAGRDAYQAPPAQGRDTYQPPPAQTRDAYQPPPAQGRDPYAQPPAQGRDAYQAPPAQGRDPYAPPPAQGRDPYAPPPAQGRDQYAPQPPQGRDPYAPPPAQGRDQYAPQPPQGRDPYAPPPAQGRDQYAPQPPQGRDPYAPPPAQGRDTYQAPANPRQGGYTAPGPSSQPYTAPSPGNQPYSAPSPANQPYTAPGPASQSYTAPGPANQGYTAPGPANQGYSATGPSNQQYAAPGNQGYGAPSNPQYGGQGPAGQQYGAQGSRDSRQNYGQYPPAQPAGSNPPPAQAGRDPHPAPAPPPIPHGLPGPHILEEINKKLNTPRFIAVFSDIHRCLMKKAMSVDSEFAQLDPERTGVIRDMPFKDVLFQKIDVVGAGACTQQEAIFLIENFDLHHVGWIYYREFLNKTRNPEYRIGGPPLPPKVDEGWRNNAYRLISAEIEAKRINLEEAFGRLDMQRTSQVSLADFHKTLATLGKLVTPEETSLLADEFDSRHDGQINYMQFVNRVHDSTRRKEIKERVFQDLAKFFTDKAVNFEEALRAVDPRDTKKLGRDDAVALIDRLDYKGPRQDLMIMLTELPMDTTGLLDLRELAARMPKPKQKMTPQQVFEKIKQFLMEHHTTLERVFPEFDTDGDGQLSPIEFQGALNKMNVTGLTTSEITSLIQFLDQSVDGKISLNELAAKMGIKAITSQASGDSKIVEQTMLRLKDVLTNRGKQLPDFFRDADVTQANSLTKEQLQHALLGLGITLTPTDTERLLTDLDKNRDNRISYMELQARFQQAEEAGRKQGLEAILKIKQAVRGRRVNDVFPITYDSVSRQKCIPVAEFQRSVEYLNLQLPLGEIEKVVAQLDRSKTGIIPATALQQFYDENIDSMLQSESMRPQQAQSSIPSTSRPPAARPDAAALTAHWAEKNFQEIREFCQRKQQSLADAIQAYTDGTPERINPYKLTTFLTMVTTTMNPQNMERLVRELTQAGGMVLTRDFVNLVEGVKTGKGDIILEQVKASIERSRLTVDQLFRTDPDGWVYRADLADGFNRSGVVLTAEDLVEVINILNPEVKRLNITNPAAQKVSRTMLIERLKLAPRRPGPEVEAKLVEVKLKNGIYDLMVDHIRAKNINLERDIFLPFDRNGTNQVQVEDFIQVLKRLTDNTLPRDQLELVLRDYDPKAGFIRYPPFIKKMEEGSIQKAFLDRVLTRLRGDLALRPNTIEDMCREVDRDRSGFVSFQELSQVLNRGGIYVESQELKTLCDALDHNAEGKVSYADLQRRISRPAQAAQQSSFAAAQSQAPMLQKTATQEWTGDNSRKLRVYLNARQMSAKDAFREMDKDRNNTLSGYEFQLGLGKMGTQMTEPEIQRLMTALDLNKDGRISLTEFERIIGVLPKDPWADRLTQELRAQIKRGNYNLRALYSDADANRDGLLSHDELVSAAQRLSGNTPVMELRKLAEYLDIDREGQISYPIFSKAFDPESISDLNMRFKQELERRRIDLLAIFQPLDVNRDKCLQPDIILDQIRRLSLGLSDAELQALMWENVLYRTKDGRVSYADLMEQAGMLTPRPYAGSEQPARPPASDPLKSSGYDPPRNSQYDPPKTSAYDPPRNSQYDPPKTSMYDPPRATDLQRQGALSSQQTPPPATPSFGGGSSVPPQSFAQASTQPPLYGAPTPARQPLYMGTWAEGYYQGIKDYLARTYTTVKELFAEFDIDRNNFLTPFEFNNMLQRVGIQMAEADLRRLADDLDTNKDGKVSLMEFERILGVPSVDVYAEKTLDGIIRTMRASGLRPRDIFERYDQKRDGQLTYIEFERALRDLQVNLPYQDIQQVIKYMDIDRDGRISYTEFMMRLEGENAKTLNVRVAEHLKSTGVDLLAVLKDFDSLGDGYMRLADLKVALDRLRFPVTLDETNTLAQQTGVRRREDGRISYIDLLEKLGCSVQPAASSATQAVAKVRQHWTSKGIVGDKLFLRYDINNDQHVTPQSFFEALSYLNCPITRTEVDLISSELTKLPDGRINYPHFLAKISRQGLVNYSLPTYSRIRSQLELRNVNLADTFRMFDLAGDGKVSRENVKAAFTKMQVTVSEMDLSCIMDDLDQSMNGRISYSELIAKIRAPGQGGTQTGMTIKHPYLQEIEKLRTYMKANRKTVKEFFSELDKDNNNAISHIEFATALRTMGINIPDPDLRKLTDELDPRREGRITLPAFERLFAEEMADEKFLQKQFDIIRGGIQMSRLDPRTVFGMTDQYNAGTITKADFITAIERFCPSMTRSDSGHMTDLLDSRGDGKINYEDFLRRIMEEPIESLNEKARNFIHSNGISLANAFAQFDQGDQCVTVAQMRTVLEGFRLPLRPEEMTRLIHDNRLYRTSDQRLSYRDLMERIGLREKPIPSKPKAADIFARIREAWKTAGVNPQDVFRSFDYEGDQHLTVDNLGRALARANTPATKEELDALAADLSKLPDGRVSATSFIQRVLGQTAANPTNTIYAKIKVLVTEKRIDFMRLLQQSDRDQDRFLTYEEFAAALKSINILLSDPEYWTIFEDLDKSHERRISYPELVSRIGASTPPVSRQDLTLFLPQLNLIKSKLAEFRVTFEEYFRRNYRAEADGTLGVNEFKDALSRMGMSVFAPETQNFINVFIVRGQQRVDLGELEFAIRDLAVLQTTAARPRYRMLSREDTEYVYQCLDYIADCIKDSRETPQQVVRRYDVNHNSTIEFTELRKLVNEELKIPSEEGVLGDIFLLLENEKGVIPEQMLVDALTGVRIKQRVQGPGGTSIPTGPAAQDPVAGLRDFIRQRGMTLSNLFGRATGTVPADSFKQALSNAGYRPAPQVIDLLISRIATNLSQQIVSLDTLESLLAAVNAQATAPGTDLVSRLKAFLAGRNIGLQQLVGRTSGQVDTENIVKLLANYGFTFTRDEQFAFTTQFGTDTTGRSISIDKLAAQLTSPGPANYFRQDPAPQQTMSGVENAAFNPRAAVSRAFPNMPANMQDAVLALNSKLEELRLSTEDAFAQFDQDRDGVLTRDEFVQACNQLQIAFPPEIATALFASFDTNNSGTLSLNEFARKLTGARAPERRMNANISEDLDREIRALFDFFDTDKSGIIEEEELRQALRAYNFAGTETDMKNMIMQMDKNRDGKIQYSEFKAVMEGKIMNENTGKEEEMKQLRQKFIAADYDQMGYLAPTQLAGVLQQLNIDVPQGDLQAVLAIADANKDGKIDIDEFMMLMTTDDPSILANQQVMAARFSINRARKLSPIDFLNMFAGVPKHFMQSFVTEEQRMGRLLPANEIVPTLDKWGLTIKDVSMYPQQDRFNRTTYLRSSQPACGGQITIRLAKGVPIPDPTQVNHQTIIRRLVKVCLYDEKRNCFVGNSCFLEGLWRPQEQDIWNYEQAQDKDIICFRTGSEGADVTSMSLIFEFTIFIVRQQPIEMSCGFARLPLANFDRSTNLDLPLTGGTPSNPVEINMADVRVKRSGLKSLLLKTGSMIIRPTLSVVLKSYRRLTQQESGEIDSLPSYSVVRKKGVQLVNMYREEVARTSGEKVREGFTVPVATSSFITYFPAVMNCSDLWVPLINYWTSPEAARLTTVNMNDQASALRFLMILTSRLYALLKAEEFMADETALYKFSFGMAGDLYNKRQQWVTRALSGTANPQAEALKFKPFSASELMPKSLLNLDQLMSRQVLTSTKPRGGAQSPISHSIPANATAVPATYQRSTVSVIR